MTQILFSFFILFLFTGSGIFVSPSGLLVRTGSVGVSFIIWLACGLLSLLGEYIERDLNALSPLSHHPLKRCPSRPSCNGLFIGPSITCPHMFIRMFACVCVCVAPKPSSINLLLPFATCHCLLPFVPLARRQLCCAPVLTLYLSTWATSWCWWCWCTSCHSFESPEKHKTN